eukprot:scaffold40888_cov56-Attheya_sp.AAC.3
MLFQHHAFASTRLVDSGRTSVAAWDLWLQMYECKRGKGGMRSLEKADDDDQKNLEGAHDVSSWVAHDDFLVRFTSRRGKGSSGAPTDHNPPKAACVKEKRGLLFVILEMSYLLLLLGLIN